MRRIILVMLTCWLPLGCGNLERDNPLDPKNPHSYANRCILVELFVNDSTGFEYCNYALDAVERLAQRDEFKNKLFVIEYHLTNRTHNWNDFYARDEFNLRYYQYVPNLNERGIPDAMFNGLVKRVQGASLENIDHRYADAADALLGQKSYFLIEAQQRISSNSIQLDITIARYGTSNAENIDLNAVLCEDLGTSRYHWVARKIFQKQTILLIKKGEVKAFRFIEPLPEVNDLNNLFVVAFLQDQKGPTKQVYQVTRF